MRLGKLGVWAWIDCYSAVQAAEFAQQVEEGGYGALWIPEGVGREVFTASAWLLANTRNLIIASGIATIYARDPISAAAAQLGLNEQWDERFLLGLGVSHKPQVEGVRRHDYGSPIATMRAYLEGMHSVPYQSVRPVNKPKTLLAALGPKMLELSASHADGAHPYNVTPDHTRIARDILGNNKLLCVEQAAILETDASKARARGRKALAVYMDFPNYINNWRRLGFNDADFASGGSNRLVDSVIAWGDETAIRRRLEQHWQAGADHVCVQAIGIDGAPDQTLIKLLSPRGGN
jgi:probable F420-dependent oxidoreductase